MEIEINDEEINVKEIMRQIKENIQKRNIDENDINILLQEKQSPKFDFSEIEESNFVLNRTWHYSADTKIFSHRKFIGQFIVFSKKMIRKILRWYINPVVEKQVEFNANIVRSFNSLSAQLELLVKENVALREKLIALENANQEDQNIKKLRIEKILQEIKNLEDFTQNIQSKIIHLEEANQKNQEEENLDNYIKEKVKEIQNLYHEFQESNFISKTDSNDVIYTNNDEKIEKEVLNLKEEFLALKKVNREKEQEFNSLKSNLRIGNERLRRMERKLKDNGYNLDEILINHSLKEKNTTRDIGLDFDYYLFEEIYRGSREEIKARQKIYLKYFKKSDLVLDLGSGRGEFTELLIENGTDVKAVDLDDDMVSYCKDRNFPIIKEDILTYLDAVEDNSIGGIFLGQVIEHLDSNDLIKLIQLSYKKLKPTGVFIAETPNPQSLSIFSQGFYMDLTHLKPVHPITAKFLLETNGFNSVEVNYISPNEEQVKLPEIKLEGVNSDSLKQFNERIKIWNEVVFGYQDYYIVGKK